MSASESEPRHVHELEGALWHEQWKIASLSWAARELIQYQFETSTANEKLVDALNVMMEVVGEAANRIEDVHRELHQQFYRHEQKLRSLMHREHEVAATAVHDAAE